MTYDVPRCEWEHCTGHLGKFQSCRDEALWQMSLDGFEESTGDVDWDGHFTLIVLDEPTPEDLDGHEYIVPRGNYIVECLSSGAVHVVPFTSPEAAREAFAATDSAYGEWLGDES